MAENQTMQPQQVAVNAMVQTEKGHNAQVGNARQQYDAENWLHPVDTPANVYFQEVVGRNRQKVMSEADVFAVGKRKCR